MYTKSHTREVFSMHVNSQQAFFSRTLCGGREAGAVRGVDRQRRVSRKTPSLWRERRTMSRNSFFEPVVRLKGSEKTRFWGLCNQMPFTPAEMFWRGVSARRTFGLVEDEAERRGVAAVGVFLLGDHSVRVVTGE